MAGIVGIIIGIIIHHFYRKKVSVIHFSFASVCREWSVCIIIGLLISACLFGA